MATIVGRAAPDVIQFKPPYVPAWLDNPIEFKRSIVPWLLSPYVKGTLTNTQPVDVEGKGVTGKHMPSFADEFYNRIHVTPAQIQAGNVIGEQIYAVNVFNGFFTNANVTGIAGTGIEGITFGGIATPALMLPLATLQGQIIIGTQGPPTIDAQFLFTFDIYQNIILPITGSRVIALPFQPKAPFSESLEWNTKVLTSNNGTEQRVCMRFKPRQTFEGVYPIPPEQMARANNLLFGWLGQRWAVPVWSESQLVRNIEGTNVIPCETGTTDIRVGGLVMIWNQATLFEILEVESIASTFITTRKPVANAYVAAMLMPMRSGTTGNNVGVKKTNYGGEASIAYEVSDNIELASAAPAQYLGEDLYFDEVLVGEDGSFGEQYQNRIDRIDYGTTFEISLPWLTVKAPRTVRYVMEKLADSWKFRLWLHRRKGKLRPYWLPTFENNMRLKMTGVVSSSLIIEADDYKGLADARDHIAIQYNDGTWRVRAITGSSSVSTGVSAVAIDTALNTDASNIRRISFLGLYRLDTDTPKIEWIGNQVATCDLPIMQIDS